MIRKLFWLIILSLVFSTSTALAYDWPDANIFIYPPYEVNFYNTLNEIASNANKTIDFNAAIKYIVNFDFDLKNNKNRVYTASVINRLADIMQNYESVITSENQDRQNFINEFENINRYDDETIFKKIKVWVFLNEGYLMIQEFESEKDYYDLINRRHKILQNIAANNKEYSALADFLLIWCDNISILSAESPKDKINTRLVELQMFIDKYPNSEFSAITKIEMIEINSFTEPTEKIVESYNEVFNINNNFYIGGCDLYSSIYYQLMNLYCDLKDKEKTFFFHKFINKNVDVYQQTYKHFENLIDNTDPFKNN
jgi:hypothetical protein